MRRTVQAGQEAFHHLTRNEFQTAQLGKIARVQKVNTCRRHKTWTVYSICTEV